MKNKLTKIFFVLLSLILVTLTIVFIISKKKPLEKDGEESPVSEISEKEVPATSPHQIEKQETYSYDVLLEDSGIVASVKKIKTDFEINDIKTSFPSAITKLKNGDEVLLLSGCMPSNCGGTNSIIAYNKTDRQSYLLAEKTGSTTGYEIFGNPLEEIKNLLVYYFTRP